MSDIDRSAGSETLSNRRIAILVQNLPVPFDRRVWQEATTLASAGAGVTVVCPDDDGYPAGDFNIDGVRVLRYSRSPEAKGPMGYLREYSSSLRRMRKTLATARRQGAFDAIHFCNPPDMLYLVARRWKRKDGSRLVFDQHDLGPELVRAKRMPLGRFFEATAQFFERQTYRTADHVIATNQSYRAIAMDRGGFDSADVTVIRSGPPRSWPHEGFEAADWHQGADYLIGYVGVMGRQEGIEFLLEAMVILVSKGVSVRLALIGSGPDRDRLEELRTQLGLDAYVDFHGRVSDADMKSILSDSDVCVNPDEVNELNNLSTMNKIIEYMALGRPIVQFDVREGRYSAQDSSLYARENDSADFAAKIDSILVDRDLAARMADSGRHRFTDELSWEPQGERLVSAYAQLLSGTSTGR